MKKILIFIGYYLPGYKGGGQLRTIANLVEHLSDEFEFYIVTQDRDLGDDSPYPDIEVNKWIKQKKSNIFYVSPDKISLRFINNIIKDIPHDLVYLNSFFDSTFTLKVLLSKLLFKSVNKPIILAPRGEFSGGALSLKPFKKHSFIKFAKLLKLHKDVIFQASSELEKKDILQGFNSTIASRIRVAIDLPEKITIEPDASKTANELKPDKVKLIFISRISPKKNLDYALEALSSVKINVVFDIYGPLEDVEYWARCQKLIKKLPTNIKCEYKGVLTPDLVKSTFAKYDIFYFPTKGENYGHVIAEAISVGTVALISDQTPWLEMEKRKLGWSLPLADKAFFAKTIDDFAKLTAEERAISRDSCKQNAIELLNDPILIEQSRKLFREFIS